MKTGGSTLPRRPKMIQLTISCTGSAFWFRTSKRIFTRPMSGRERLSFVSSTVWRVESLSPGRTGLIQRSSSSPGAP